MKHVERGSLTQRRRGEEQSVVSDVGRFLEGAPARAEWLGPFPVVVMWM